MGEKRVYFGGMIPLELVGDFAVFVFPFGPGTYSVSVYSKSSQDYREASLRDFDRAYLDVNEEVVNYATKEISNAPRYYSLVDLDEGIIIDMLAGH